ncbi:MAG: hypothetical protein ACI4CC_03120 [Lachnospiraceae bacterium]
MIGQMTLSNPHPYSVEEIPKFDIDYRGLIRYARSVGKSVKDLSDGEKEQFIHGNTMDDIRRCQLTP